MGQEIQLYDNPLIKNLQQGITATGNFEISAIDKLGVNLELKKFKHQNGSIDFAAIRDIPNELRIYQMAKKDLGTMVKLIAVAITMATESMNLTRPINAFQILDISEAIIEESEQDKLSIQDVLLFLQRLTRGYYPGLFEGFDSVKFFERFNQYRDERWDEMRAIRDAKIEEQKRQGDDNYYERHNKMDADTLDMQLSHYRQKSMEKKDQKALNKRYDK